MSENRAPQGWTVRADRQGKPEPPAEPDGEQAQATPPPSSLPDTPHEAHAIERVAGLGAVAASAYLHAGGWAISQSLKASKRVAGAMTSPTQAATLAVDVVKGTRDVLGTIIEATNPAAAATGAAKSVADAAKHASERTEDLPNNVTSAAAGGPELLRRAGENLLRRSRELDEDASIHPAYERILSELSPDEGRVIRLMLLGGPQPAVEVRTGGIFGFFNTHVIKRGLTMIGARAGLRHADQVPSYLNNLFRLGLIWVSPETIRDYQRYQVLEAQPEVADAMDSVRRARVVRRSIHLTPFGEDFARTTFDTGNAHELPAHSDPDTPVTTPSAETADPFA